MHTDFNLTILEDGYMPLNQILELDTDKISLKGYTLEDIRIIVDNDKKNRFSLIFKNDIAYIRANQGHSTNVGNCIKNELLLTKITESMNYCVHGTTLDAASIIKIEGLKKMSRTHIHFASSRNAKSGIRNNAQVLIHCDMKSALKDNINFWLSENNVILSSDDMDPKYLTFEYPEKQKKFLPCYGILVFNKDKTSVVLVKTHKNNYGFPKGKKHKNETINECALRELHEETGITKENIDIVNNDFIIENSNNDNPAIGYLVGIIKNDIEFTYDKEELESVNWFL